MANFIARSVPGPTLRGLLHAAKHLCVLLMALLWSSLALASELSPADAKTKRQLQMQLEQTCKEGMKQQNQSMRSGRTGAPSAALARWASDIADPETYCSCTANRIFAQVSVEFLLQASEEQGVALGRKAGAQCMLPRLKTSFPAFCREMLSELAPTATRSQTLDRVAGEICTCTQQAIDATTPETIEAFIMASLQDHATFQRSRVLPPPGRSSLIAQMNACGMAEFRTRLLEAQ